MYIRIRSQNLKTLKEILITQLVIELYTLYYDIIPMNVTYMQR